MALKYQWQRLLVRIYLRYISGCFYLITRLVLLFLKRAHTSEQPSLLIIKPDAIGDYILMRNFLHSIRSSKKFGGYQITFFGNALYKDFAEHFDHDSVDSFIWIDKNRIYRDIFYYLRTVIKLYEKYTVVIHPVGSREFIFDTLVKISCNGKRIGMNTDTVNIIDFYKRISDQWYSQLISIDHFVVFEFYRIRKFFEILLEQPITIEKPFLEKEKVSSIALPAIHKNYIVIFPGAQLFFRRWPANNFAPVCDFLHDKYGLKVLIAGGHTDRGMALQIIRLSGSVPVDFTGKTSLIQLPGIIQGAKLLITNDTVAVHLGALVNTPTIILSQLNHYKRFVPYPPEMNIPQICIIPEFYQSFNSAELEEKFRLGSDVNIDLITVEMVIKAIEKFFSERLFK